MQQVLILDFGSQFTQLITRRIREIGLYSKIISHKTSIEEIQKENPIALVLSGGPSSVFEPMAPKCDPQIFELGIPILGICYGMQLMTQVLGGKVHPGKVHEYGRNQITHLKEHPIWDALPPSHQVWMSHGDTLENLPKGFHTIAQSETGLVAAIAHEEKKMVGLQFHPEVTHSEKGLQILKNFFLKFVGVAPDWSMGDFSKDTIEGIQKTVGHKKVLCALSGGVDSSVAATLVSQAVGDQLICLFVDHGLLRSGDREAIEDLKRIEGLNVQVVDAQKEFLDPLKGVTDPEEKRKIIGHTFIEVFKAEAKKLKSEFGNLEFLVQGTLYPDVIESISPHGEGVSSKIKSHHNVGGLPKDLPFTLIEPLRALFKDEVRTLGRLLGVPNQVLRRHPFPGPGLAIRIIGDVTSEKLELLREADRIFIEELHRANIYDEIWQAFAVLTPLHTVGVKGDKRSYENVLALRAVTSHDGMTADWVEFSHSTLKRISNRLSNEVKGVGRVVYDITSKPPGTIEWE